MIALMLGLLLALYYALLAQPQHAAYLNAARDLFYAPIFYGAIRYGLRGGLTVSLCSVAALLPGLTSRWTAGGMGQILGLLIEQFAHVAAGGVIGWLADRWRRSARELEAASHQLRTAYSGLKRKSDELSLAYSQLRVRTKEVFEWQEQVRRADKFLALAQMTSGLAHEVRNPLGAIDGAAQILRDKAAAGQTDRELAEIIVKESKRLDHAVQEFLAFARGEEAPSLASAVDPAIEDALAAIREEAGRRKIRIRYECRTPGLRVAMPREQLRQALLNLVLNSLQAIGRKGEITVVAQRIEIDDSVPLRKNGRAMPGALRLVVEDTGSGVPPEIADRIFDPFYTTHSDHVGLGLAIVQRIVMNCGGALSLDRSHRDGARFEMILPLAPDAE